MRIIDADRHVIEPTELWREYLEPGFRDAAPYEEVRMPAETLPARLERLGPKGLIPIGPTLMLDGQPVARELSERAQVEVAWAVYQRPGLLAAGASPTAQLRSMDASGVDIAVLFPSYTMWLLALESLAPERSAALARAYNSWLRDFCKTDPRRLRGVGAISRHDPAQMVAEAERVAGFGWTSVLVWPNPLHGRLLSDPSYEPFWSTCERLSLAVGIHAGAHGRIPTAGDRFQTRFAQHACVHPMEQMMALLALIEGGVLERHPGLRVAFLEAGCSWLPSWLWRLDEMSYRYARAEVEENVRMKPSEYFRRQCFISVEPSEPQLAEVLRVVGPDCLVFGSDFPHVDHEGDIVAHALELGTQLPEDAVRRLLWDNPARLYRLEP